MDDLIGGLTLVLGGFVFVFAIITLAVAILMIIANIFIFRKMGLPGWYSIIPFWNVYNQVSKTWLVTPWFWVYLGLFVAPWFLEGFLLSVVSILAFALGVAMNLKLAAAFGKGVGYCLGLIFLPVIFLPVLAFGQATYIGNQTTPGKLF
ncbi:DUF5684 domain-containing protein [Intestinimonas massiliensis (ex Afouda et al. 2020)]|uniref:DUF5684 domain-containing protein n=1 Tax=Intestinimonas massiliensis (ex Afouda et al. 2020) TaxID=1673721 RepID=A0ABS9MDJ0_9FIRM|nr:DUF5684 domain-containing protein [Intestinimonas massiliensis (ex Afouda et al. 2020)]MCG4528866.1 DUF5684 domain-containing protein [Intestinimonas massiliensis (ex Afouda et al. 2020)]